MSGTSQPPGWYAAEGDPAGTVRWWDGNSWVGGPQQQGIQQQAGYVAPGVGSLANGRQVADPWLRIAAKIIDTILLGIIGAIIGLIFIGGSAGFGDITSFGTAETVGLTLTSAVITAGYYWGMNSFVGGTLGKLAMGIRIVSEDGTDPIGPNVGIVRSAMNVFGILAAIPIVGLLIQLITGIVGLVSLVFLFTDAEHRTVMDRAAKTYVVKKQ